MHRGWLGDANDDGLVNFADFMLLSNNMGTAGAGWNGGDFNNDGITNFSDFVILSNNFGKVIGGGNFAAASAASEMPEPAGLLLLTAGFLGAMGSRPRHNSHPSR